jgi:hypothetical protein
MMSVMFPDSASGNQRINTVPDQTQPKSESSAKPESANDWWRPKLINVKKLCDMKFEPLKYVVPEGVTLLASRPKLGKSWLILQIHGKARQTASIKIITWPPLRTPGTEVGSEYYHTGRISSCHKKAGRRPGLLRRTLAQRNG